MNKQRQECNNCSTSLEGSYCHNCGQRSHIHKVTFAETFQDLASGLFTLEAPIWRTTRTLFLRPGVLFSEYLSGQRKKYYKPVAYFILTTALFILIRSILKFDPMATLSADTSLKTDVTIFYEAGKFMSANINNFMFIFAVTLGISLKSFFYKRYSLAEFIAISFYALSVYTLITAFVQIYWKYVSTQASFLPALLFGLFLVYAMANFIKGKLWVVIVKSILACFMSYVLYIIISFAVSLTVVYLR